MIRYVPYSPAEEDQQLEIVRQLVSEDLSEPYSIYVYRHFVYDWPGLCILAYDGDSPVGVIVGNVQNHRNARKRGYIAMLVVKETYRGRGIAKALVTKTVDAIRREEADEITLETEATNEAAMNLYENMGFLRLKRLHRYYLNASDAFRLILPLTEKSVVMSQFVS